MANQATIASLETIVRSRLNLTNMATVSSVEMRQFIRSALAQFYELIANRHRDYFVVPYKFSFAANKDTYPLPMDFRSAAEMFVTFGTAPNLQRMPLQQFTLNQYQTRSVSTLLAPAWPTMYRIMGANVYFTPCPSDDYNNAVELWYIPQWSPPTTDDTTIGAQFPNGWERWVEYDVCVQVASRLRIPEYYTMYSQQRDKIEQAVIAAASIRDEQPEYMTDAFDTPWTGLNRPGEQ